MSTPILLPDATLRQAVAQFKRVYPNHAKTYAAQLATAKRIVRAGAVHPDDQSDAYLVGTLSKKNALLVQNHQCACGESVCCHRLAVCVAVIGDEMVRAERLRVSEHFAVLNEEQDPHADAHSEHGTWNTQRQHVCCDTSVVMVPSSPPGKPIVCPHCAQVYCPDCDSEVVP